MDEVSEQNTQVANTCRLSRGVLMRTFALQSDASRVATCTGKVVFASVKFHGPDSADWWPTLLATFATYTFTQTTHPVKEVGFVSMTSWYRAWSWAGGVGWGGGQVQQPGR